MKKTLLLLLAAAAVVGCKKGTEDPTPAPINPDVISIGANLSLTKATLPTVFSAGSQIGLYEAFVAADKSIESFRLDNIAVPGSEVYNENLPYQFGADVNSSWNNVDALKKLTWAYENDNKDDGDRKIYLVGYHPYGTVKFFRNEFKLVADQTSEAALKKADLMWAMTTGTKTADNTFEQLTPGYKVAEITTTGGLTKTKHSSKAVNMMFHHMLSKFSYRVRFVKPATATDKFENPVITGIKILGPNITVAGKLDLKTGVYAADENVAGVIPEIFWAPAEADYVKYVKENGDPIEIKTSDVKAENADLADYVYCCDLIAQPADFTGKFYNFIEFAVTYDYTPKDGTVEKRSQTYRYPLGKADFVKFERNKQYNAKAVIELNTDFISISAQINPWDVLNPGEIQPF